MSSPRFDVDEVRIKELATTPEDLKKALNCAELLVLSGQLYDDNKKLHEDYIRCLKDIVRFPHTVKSLKELMSYTDHIIQNNTLTGEVLSKEVLFTYEAFKNIYGWMLGVYENPVGWGYIIDISALQLKIKDEVKVETKRGLTCRECGLYRAKDGDGYFCPINVDKSYNAFSISDIDEECELEKLIKERDRIRS